MQPKTLRILGVVLVVLVAAWGLTVVASRTPEPKEKYLWEKAQDARRLAIGDMVLVKTGTDWSLEKPFKARADHSKIEDFLGKLAKITISDPLSSDPSRHEYFMVTASSGIHLQGFLEEKAATPALDILVGKNGSEYDSLLFRRPNETDVVEGRGLARYEFEQSASKWADRAVAKIDASSVRSLEVRAGKETLRLKRVNGRWHLAGTDAPLSTATVSGLVEPMLSKLSALDAEEVLPEATVSSTTLKGLRNPELRIAVRYGDGVTAGPAKVLEKTMELAIAPKGSDSRCAVRKGGDKLIYVVSSWALDVFRKKEADFKDVKATLKSS